MQSIMRFLVFFSICMIIEKQIAKDYLRLLEIIFPNFFFVIQKLIQYLLLKNSPEDFYNIAFHSNKKKHRSTALFSNFAIFLYLTPYTFFLSLSILSYWFGISTYTC